MVNTIYDFIKVILVCALFYIGGRFDKEHNGYLYIFLMGITAIIVGLLKFVFKLI